ncbi:hypothetical protein PSX44_23475, partial [Shigella flexneri]|nr:hypothetical protein [Shigella flexneri]
MALNNLRGYILCDCVEAGVLKYIPVNCSVPSASAAIHEFEKENPPFTFSNSWIAADADGTEQFTGVYF